MSEHTPGPWIVYEPDVNSLELRDGCGGYICELTTVGWEIPPDAMANGHLIAAAPDLLAALKLLLGHSGLDIDAQDKDPEDHAAERVARAAIAKATGERK